MAQITIAVPTVPKDWHTTLLGVIGAIGLLLKQYMATGTFTYEGVAIAVFVAVVCYFIPAKIPTEKQADVEKTIQGIVDAMLKDKIPTALTGERTVNGVEQAVVDAAAAQAPLA